MTRNKYHAKKCVIDGEVFDSKAEMRRWQELQILEKAGEIQNLRRQVKFVLIPAQREANKTVERECSCIADFVYDENGMMVVEDCKGVRTEVYKLKKKMMLYFHGIRIREV